MARVIKPPSGHKKVKCGSCLSTIAYAPREVQEVNGRDISGGPDGHKFIVCPATNCRQKIILEQW